VPDTAAFGASNRCDLDTCGGYFTGDPDNVGQADFLHIRRFETGRWKISRALSCDRQGPGFSIHFAMG